MSETHSDAVVFFGAIGDLAYKKIFPSLQGVVKREHLNVPVIGVANENWDPNQSKALARDSVEKHGGLDPAAFEKLAGLLRYVDGDYAVRCRLHGARRRTAASPLPRHSVGSVREGSGATRDLSSTTKSERYALGVRTTCSR
jgi:glucose-6-phosphate 1-dehydrogenase